MANQEHVEYPLHITLSCPKCEKKFVLESKLDVTTTRQEDGVVIEVKDRVPCKCKECGTYMQIAITDFLLQFGIETLETI